MYSLCDCTVTVKATVDNPRGCVEKLSPKESVEGPYTVLRDSKRVPKVFSEGKPEAAKHRGRSHQCFAAKGLPKENPLANETNHHTAP